MEYQTLISAINDGRKEDLATLRRELDQRYRTISETLERIENDYAPRLKKLEDGHSKVRGAGVLLGMILLVLEGWYHVVSALAHKS